LEKAKEILLTAIQSFCILSCAWSQQGCVGAFASGNYIFSSRSYWQISFNHLQYGW